MTDHTELIEIARAKAQTDSPVHELLRDLAEVLELTLGHRSIDADVIANFQKQVRERTAERDAARAVIEQAKKFLTDTRETSEMRNRNAYGALDQSPASALAEVKADTLREYATNWSSNPEDADEFLVHEDVLAVADAVEKAVGL